MEKTQNQEIVSNLQMEVKLLLGQNTAKELEETLFQVFEESYLFSEPDSDEKTRRAMLHCVLRKTLRLLHENPEFQKTLTS